MIYEESDWQVGTTNENPPTIIRARSNLPNANYRGNYQHLIVIKWSYIANSDTGMPDKTTQESMDSFENALTSKLSEQDIGILTVIITGQSLKEWRYYTSDAQKFMSTINEISHDNKPYPIDLQLFNDPDWEALNEVINNK